MAIGNLAQIKLNSQDLLNGDFLKHIAAFPAVAETGDVIGNRFYDTLDVFLCKLNRTSEDLLHAHGPWAPKESRAVLTHVRTGLKKKS